MGWEAGRSKTSTAKGIFIVIPSLKKWPTKSKEAPSPHEVRLALHPSEMKMTKQAFLTDFLITNFFVLKLRRKLIKKFGGGILIEN